MSNPNTSLVKFKFVGGSGKVSTEKLSWPVACQAIVIRNNMIGGLPAKAAFEAGVQEYNDLVTSGEIKGEPMPTDLPESYTNKNSGSVLWGLKSRFLKRAEKGNKETIEAGLRFGVLQPTEDEVSEVSEDKVSEDEDPGHEVDDEEFESEDEDDNA